MPRKKIELGETKTLVLCYLYLHAMKENSENLYMSEIYDNIDQSSAFIDIALDSLHNDSLCSKYEIQTTLNIPFRTRTEYSTVDCARITLKGIEVVEKWSDEFHDSVVKRIILSSENLDFGQHLSTTDNNIITEVEEIPASDRYVTIDHNQAKVAETISTLDRAIQEFKEDKMLDNELGQEKAALAGALEAGRKLLDDTNVWLGTAISTLIQPLKRIAAKYKEAAIQGGASAVINLALGHLLSLFDLS